MRLIKFILPFIFIFFSCSRDSDETVQNTRLELSIFDESNTAVPNAEVYLYASQNDFNNDTNIIQSLTTDSAGKVTFENLQAMTYYWKIYSECKINNDVNNSTNPISANSLNPFSIHLTNNNTGNVEIRNISAFDFDVNYTGPETGSVTVSANSSVFINILDAGEYIFTSIRTDGGVPPSPYSYPVYCGETGYIEIDSQ